MADAHVQERILELRQVPMLRSVSPRMLAELAASVEVEAREAGAVLQRAGEAARSIAWIVEGRASWEREGRGLGAAERGASLGLLEIMASRGVAASARAEAPVVLARIAAERWVELLEDSFDIALAVLASIAAELAALGRRRFGDAPSLAARRREVPASRDLDFTERIVRLRMSRPFSRAPIRALAVLAQRSVIRDVPRGAAVWERGVEAREIAVLLAGAAAEGHARFGPGDTLGLVEALAGRRRDAAAIARSTVAAVVFDVEALLDVLEDDEELTLELLRECADELLAACLARGLPPDVLGGAPDRSLPRGRRAATDTGS